jgi:transposase
MRVYDKEFKEEAIKLSYEIGNKVASKQLGIPVTTLYTWRSRHNQYGTIAFLGSGR